MRIAFLFYGTRGDVEPGLAVANQLKERGHWVVIAVPPNLLPLATQFGFDHAVAYGPDSAAQIKSRLFRDFYQLQNPFRFFSLARDYLIECWQSMASTAWGISADVDLIVNGTQYQEIGLNVAEARGLPMASIHYFPCRPSSAFLPSFVPPKVSIAAWKLLEWLYWQLYRSSDDEQRISLGLLPAKVLPSKRMSRYHVLELQAYSPFFFPGLADQLGCLRPFVGTLTLCEQTDYDDFVLNWIQSGRPPVCLALGSMTEIVTSDVGECVRQACSELGLRLILVSHQAGTLISDESTEDVIVIPRLSHTRIFPQCCVVIHHGGSGTCGAVMRAGVPSIVLWVSAEQPLWARAVTAIGVGVSHRLISISTKMLISSLQRVRDRKYILRAKQLSESVMTPSQSVQLGADLLENHAASRHASIIS